MENYKENGEMDYTKYNQWWKNVESFRDSGHFIHPVNRKIYEFIRTWCRDYVVNHPQYPKFKWKPKIIDVGCGSGLGTNILSQEGEFVWGIDVNPQSIAFAQEVFTRYRNNIYFTPELQYEVIDVKTEDREIQAFDVVACIELIEHIDDYEKVLEFLKKRCKKSKGGQYLEPHDATVVFISTPNRNNGKAGTETPVIKKHVREWTPAELYEILTKHFKYVTIMNEEGELRELNMTDDTMLFKCETPV